MVRKSKCSYCGAPLDLSSNRCNFCNQEYDFNKANKILISLKNNSHNSSKFLKKKFHIFREFIKKVYEKKHTKKVILIYLPISIFIIFSGIITTKFFLEKIELASKEKRKLEKYNLFIESGNKKFNSNRNWKQRYSEALADYNKAAELNIKDPKAYLKIAYINFIRTSNYKVAARNYTKAIEATNQKKDLSCIYFMRSYSYGSDGSFNKASDDMTKVLQLSEVYGLPTRDKCKAAGIDLWTMNTMGNSDKFIESWIYFTKLYSYFGKINNDKYLAGYGNEEKEYVLNLINKVFEIYPEFYKKEPIFYIKTIHTEAYILTSQNKYKESIAKLNIALKYIESNDWIKSQKALRSRIGSLYGSRAISKLILVELAKKIPKRELIRAELLKEYALYSDEACKDLEYLKSLKLEKSISSFEKVYSTFCL